MKRSAKYRPTAEKPTKWTFPTFVCTGMFSASFKPNVNGKPPRLNIRFKKYRKNKNIHYLIKIIKQRYNILSNQGMRSVLYFFFI